MRCFYCGEKSKLLAIQSERDDTLQSRRYQCARGHKFLTSEIHVQYFNQLHPPHHELIGSLTRRRERVARDDSIRQMAANGMPRYLIARKYKLTPQRISQICQATE